MRLKEMFGGIYWDCGRGYCCDKEKQRVSEMLAEPALFVFGVLLGLFDGWEDACSATPALLLELGAAGLKREKGEPVNSNSLPFVVLAPIPHPQFN